MKKPKDIDEYISGYPREIKKLLEQFRATIRKAAPKLKRQSVMEYPLSNTTGYWFGLQPTRSTLAFTRWPREGLPNNPRAWLTQELAGDLQGAVLHYRAAAVRTGASPSATICPCRPRVPLVRSDRATIHRCHEINFFPVNLFPIVSMRFRVYGGAAL
jgi:hypothetical protein